MSNFTYEFENSRECLEMYEWDNVWWEHATRTDLTRVLYVGDSISCATRTIATERSGNTIFFDGFGTSKAVDNPFFVPSLRMFAQQQGYRSAILFNSGLHGWHLEDETEYRKGYEEMIKFFLNEFPNTPLFLLLTTGVAKNERNERVLVRNKVVKSLAEKYNLPTIDFYSITDSHRDLISSDGVHLVPDGYKLLADELIANVKKCLESK